MTQSRGQNENIDTSFPEELRERFDEVRFVGKGGMGSVYFARDIRLDRHIAIKVLPHTSDNTASVVRFHQEARAVSKLSNPHIVRVLDFGSTEDCDFFMVMEYINGQDLEALIAKNGAFPITRAIEIAMQVCTGLEHAHANGIVHRDLKPGNIMIDENNQVRVLDFGVAKMVNQEDTEHRLTRPGQAVGSLMYMSPEQLRGEEIDSRSDVYSAGLVIYKMVAGTLPLEDEKIMKIIRMRLEEAPPALPLTQDENDEIIAKLNNVLSVALANKPIDRFESMTALRSALSDCLASPEAQGEGDPRTKNTLKIIAVLAIICVSLGALLISKTAPSPAKKTNKIALTTPAKPTVEKKELRGPQETTKNGILMPPGFSEDLEDGKQFWVAHDYVTDDELGPLLAFKIPSLSLQGNLNITKRGLSIIRDMGLESLCLRDTKIGDDSIDLINHMDLKDLNLRHTRVTNNGLLRLKPSPRMISLDFKYLPITSEVLNAIVHKFPNVVSLNIGEMRLQNGNLDVLKKLHNLRYLYIENVGIDDSRFEKLSRLNKVVRLELAANPITDVSVGYLMKKPDLEWVSFGACPNISASALDRLRKRFPNASIIGPRAETPPDTLEGIFFKGTESP